MEDLAQSSGSFRLRVIDVKDWESPVARAHGIRSLPTLVLYDGERLVSRDTREVLGLLSE